MSNSIFIGATIGVGNDLVPPSLNAVLSSALTVPTPTFSQVLSRHPQMVFTWAALTSPAYGADVIVFVHGGTWVFQAEVLTGNLTGASEPTWANANDPGETLVDGDITWTNAGLWSAFPPAPTPWTLGATYTMPAFVWPTSPNGHLYAAYNSFQANPFGEPFPWPTVFGTFIAEPGGGGTGFWMDCGSVDTTLTTEWQSPRLASAQNCFAVEGANVINCGNADAGLTTLGVAHSSATVMTTAVTADSQILIQEDSSLGSLLGVTCNTATTRTYRITARTPGTSFTFGSSASVATNPACLSFTIINAAG